MSDVSTTQDANPALESAIDALFAPEPVAEAVPVPEPEAVPVADEPVPDPEVVPAPEGEAPVEGSDKAPEATEDEVDSDEDLDAALAASAKSNPLDLASSRGKRIYQSYKTHKAISDALGEDLSVEKATAYRDAYVDMELMRHEFDSGDPERVGNFLNYWNSSNPRAMVQAAQQLPATLARTNQAAYIELAQPVLNIYVQGLYQRAKSEGNPDVQKALLYTARSLDWDLNNKFLSDEELAGGAAPSGGAVPQALSERERALAEREQRIQQFEQGQQASTRTAWNQQLDEANSSVLETQSDQALAPLKAAVTPKVYAALRRDFIEAVIADVSKDTSNEQLYQSQRLRAQSRLSSTDIQPLSQQYAQRASRVIRKLTPQFLKDYGVQITKNSGERHATLQAGAAAGKAPAGAGAPRPQSIVPGQQKFKSKGDQMEAEIDSIFGIGGAA